MPNYTTSYSTKKKPSFRRSRSSQLPSGRRRRQRKAGATYLRHSQGFGHHSGRGGRGGGWNRRSDSRRVYAVIVVACAFLVFLASILWYSNRDVDVTLNGSTVSVRIHSNIQQLIDDQGLSLNPGRLLAVDDSVLDKKGGETCHVELDGKHVEVSKLASTELTGGEELTIGNGEDEYEEHSVEATAIEPTITVEGTGAIQYVKTWGVAGRKEVWTGAVSGKTQDRGVVKEAVDCVVAARSVSPDSKKKQYVALTFDEGPGTDTEKILQILEEKGVKATFFLQGETAAANPDLVKKIADAGHDVGSNAYSDTDLSALSGDDLRSQLSRGFSAIEEAGGGSTALLRAPYGSFSTSNWAESMDIVSAVVGWNLDSGDWTLPGAETVVGTVVNYASNGNIVLLTDNDSTSAQTAEALPDIIDGLEEKGFTLVSLSDLIATDEDLAEELSLLTVKMPKDATLPTVADASQSDSEE